MSVEDLIRTVMQEFRHIVKTETVVGEPVVVGDTTIVPVSKISFGFGAGGGKDESSSREQKFRCGDRTSRRHELGVAKQIRNNRETRGGVMACVQAIARLRRNRGVRLKVQKSIC